VAGTRAALGAGIALLVGDRLGPAQRRAVGWSLVGVGVLTTIPLAVEVLKRDAIPALDGERGQIPSRDLFPE